MNPPTGRKAIVMVMISEISASDLWKSCAIAVRQKVKRKKSKASSSHAENPAITAGGWLVSTPASARERPPACDGSAADMQSPQANTLHQTILDHRTRWASAQRN